MSDTEILRRLQSYFDGIITSTHDVIYYTGLPEKQAKEVYDAIVELIKKKF
jgi:bisphosphoglycerate-independent phosphoglycerate mutase (AlkP superfamily)